MGPKSPSAFFANPYLSKYSRVVLSRQMLTPLLDKSFSYVDPLINYNSSSTILRQNTSLVVNNGIVLFRKLYSALNPNCERAILFVLFARCSTESKLLSLYSFRNYA